ncbi:MAG: hypothetical protein E7383_07990 [Ruminococcaceae bacterium]|nr:hypothetical protein [Oscillospiraceae bacterium]
MKLRQMGKTNKKLSYVLRENEGASLVLVSIIAIIIITGIIVLRMTTNTLLASADKQQQQDQAYMIAVSLGDSIDKAMKNGDITDPHALNGLDDSANTKYAIPNSEVRVTVKDYPSAMETYTVITVYSKVADAEYEYKLTYLNSGAVYVRQY